MAVILIDLRPLLQQCISEEASHFIIENLDLFCKKNPGHEYVFLIPRGRLFRHLPDFIQQKLVFKKAFPGITGWKIWYSWQIPRMMKKHGAALLISTGAAAPGSFSQWVWMPNSAIKASAKIHNSYHLYCSRNISFSIQKANAIFVFSEIEKELLKNKYPGNKDKFKIVYAKPGNDLRPFSWPEKENVKVSFAGGKEFFMVTGSGNSVVLLLVLKAFSQFKKQQQSDMQMIIAVKGISRDTAFTEKLETYKYRSDVHIHDRNEEKELVKMLCAAYGIVSIGEQDMPGTTLLNAFRACVPVIADDNAVMHETGSDAVLYADMNDVSSLSRQIVFLYKDENLRKRLQEKGLARLDAYQNYQSAPDLLSTMLKAQGT